MKRLYTILALISLSALSLFAQEEKKDVAEPEQKQVEVREVITTKADTVLLLTDEEVELRDELLQELQLTEAYDALSDDALLPITREQAERLLTEMIVEARAPRQLELKRADALRRIKLERLKEKMLDYALGAMYTDPLQRRIESLERLVFALLATNKDIDPAALTLLMPQQAGGQTQQLVPYLVQSDKDNATKEDTRRQSLSSATTQKGETKAPQEPIAISLTAPADKVEYFMSQVFFGFDSSKLTTQAKQVLDDVVAWMKSNKLSISLHGYASLEGRIGYNNKLSARRVKAVADYLKAQGIPESRIVQVPAGIDSIKENRSQYGDARRVDIRPVLY